MEGLPERFKELRKRRGLTSTALAEPRYSVSYVSQIERGFRRPSREALRYFSRRLGVSPEFLETGVPDDLPLRLRYELEQAENDLGEGSFAEAGRKARAVLAQAEEYGVPALRHWSFSVMADALFGEGLFAEAREAYERLLAEADLSRSHRVRATAGLARTSRAVGDISYAGLVVESYLDAEHDPPLDPAAIAELQSVLVSVYFERGDVALAQRAAERALAAIDETVPIRTQAVARHHASRVAAERGQWEEALILTREARTLMGTLRNRRDVAKLHTAHAFLCLEVDPPLVDEAVRQLDQAERLLSSVGDGSDMAHIHTERGRVAFLRGEYEEAARWAERAAGGQGVVELERARALYLRGRALRALGRPEEARESLREALAIFEVDDAHQQSLLCWRELGELATAEGDYLAATEAFRSGVEVAGGRASLIFQ
jgi:tetratricopeptide (TPR) repeat protein